MFKSKAAVIVSLIVIIVLIVISMVRHDPWFFFIGYFFAYMCLFSNLIALLISPRNPYAARTLVKWTYIFGGLFFLSLVALVVVGLCLSR